MNMKTKNPRSFSLGATDLSSVKWPLWDGTHSVLLLTAFMFVLSGFGSGISRTEEAILTAIAASMIFWRKLLFLPLLWFVFTAFFFKAVYDNYLFLDNHKYLFGYWFLACGVSLYFKNPGQVLRYNARNLVGICFLIATLYKIYVGEYLDFSFIEMLSLIHI